MPKHLGSRLDGTFANLECKVIVGHVCGLPLYAQSCRDGPTQCCNFTDESGTIFMARQAEKCLLARLPRRSSSIESLAALGAFNLECIYPAEMFGRYRVTALRADRV
jgi:hypothetical protein